LCRVFSIMKAQDEGGERNPPKEKTLRQGQSKKPERKKL